MKVIQFQPEWSAPVAATAEIAVKESPTGLAAGEILVADDDPVSRTLVVAVLHSAGYKTVATKDGDEAMKCLRATAGGTLAIIDWMMPGMDGAEVCRRIRGSGKSIYVIMLTARSAKEDTAAALDNGADDYLVKPFHRTELLARVRTGLRILQTQMALETQVDKLVRTATSLSELKLQMPI